MKAMPRTRVSLNSKAHQLGWLKSKKKKLLVDISLEEFFNFFGFKPAQLISFGIKRNSSPGHCFHSSYNLCLSVF